MNHEDDEMDLEAMCLEYSRRLTMVYFIDLLVRVRVAGDRYGEIRTKHMVALMLCQNRIVSVS